jgi:capsular polysaccharide transport system permease protein
MRYDKTQPAPILVQLKKGITKARTAQRILIALVLREIMTRFGREQLGFLWLILEPMILTSLVIFGWYIMFGSLKHGIPVVQLALSGYSCLTLWRHIINRLLNCYKHNTSLLFHLNVRPMDTIFARLFLETFGTLVAFFTSFTFLYLLGWIEPIADMSLVLGAWFLLASFAFAVAMCLSALSEFSEHTEKVIQPLMYITIPLTGVFSMVAWLPANLQPALLYSPIANAVEMFRAGMIGPGVETHWDVPYTVFCTVLTLAVGFLLMRAAESKIKIE